MSFLGGDFIAIHRSSGIVPIFILLRIYEIELSKRPEPKPA